MNINRKFQSGQEVLYVRQDYFANVQVQNSGQEDAKMDRVASILSFAKAFI